MGRGRKEEEGEEFLRQRNQHVQRESKRSVWSTEFSNPAGQEKTEFKTVNALLHAGRDGKYSGCQELRTSSTSQ